MTSLQPGQSLSHYHLVEKIGEGGMGVVWKAHDGKLDRDVAVKILPPEFSQDQQRLARFDREAKLLATLNHPNIAAIHGLEHTDGVHFLVLELIPGQSLFETLKDGPMPVEEALDVCRQVAEGLGAAHEAGVIHRDLKPGNVRVTPDGKAKVLDFGLAKGLEGVAAGSGSGGSASDLSQSPTVAAGTQAGVILGTAPYMSPEQARGKQLDKRTDIWSFGCLLYECLTGKIAFTGETVPDIFSAILQSDADWTALPDRTPPRVRELLERCLEKSPRNRLHDIEDARIELDKSLSAKEWTTSGVAAAEAAGGMAKSFSGRTLLVAAAAAHVVGMVLGMTILALVGGRTAGDGSTAATHLSVVPPPDLRVSSGYNGAILPDGRTIQFSASERDAPESERVGRLYSRRLDEDEFHLVEGSEGHTFYGIYSPDGRWHAWVNPVSSGSTAAQLVKAPTDGSAPPVRIADWPEGAYGWPQWVPGGEITVLTRSDLLDPPLLHRFPVDGSSPARPVEVDLAEYRDIFPWQALPDGRHLLVQGAIYGDWGDRRDVVLLDMESGTLRLLIEDARPAFWSSTGHLLFGRRETLLAVPFDLARLEISGGPVAIMDGVASPYGRYNWFHISYEGTLVYAPAGSGASHRRLAFIDGDGKVEPWSDERLPYSTVEVSPDGSRLAAQVLNPDRYLEEIWISEVDAPRLRLLAGKPGMDCGVPRWSPDSESIAYACIGAGAGNGIYLARADGTEEPELLFERRAEEPHIGPLGFLAEGALILVGRDAGAEFSLHLLPLQPGSSGSRELIPVMPETKVLGADVSPDGRWLAYPSDETGRVEVYFRSLGADGAVGPKSQISSGGGGRPFFTRTTRTRPMEIHYQQRRRLMAVSITTDPVLRISKPLPSHDLDSLEERERTHLPDGRLLIVQGSPSEGEIRELKVVLNFHELIRQKFAQAE